MNLLMPAAFWLLPLLLAALIWIRFLRGRRQEILTGSLILWRKLAAEQPAHPPRRFVLDRALILQALALAALVAALAGPQFAATSSGRTVVIAVDNGPLSRFRAQDGARVWSAIQSRARAALEKYSTLDRVLLVRAAPAPKLLTPQPVSASEAQALLNALQPALSGPDAAALYDFARNAARASNAVELSVISPAFAPETLAQSGGWIGVSVKPRENAGIVAFGALLYAEGGAERLQGLVRVHNAGGTAREIPIRASQEGGREWKETLRVPAQGDVVFAMDNLDAARPLQVSIVSDDGLGEDNAMLAQPRVGGSPLRIRFHAKLPALERLYATAQRAEILPADSPLAADLEVFAGTPPQQLSAEARAMLLIQPTSGYRFFFEVGDAVLTAPIVLTDEVSPLTKSMQGGGEAGLFPVLQAVEILRTGSYTSLLKDARSQRSLALRFTDERSRPGYVLAFTPGAGGAPEALMPSDLTALLLRISRDAAGRGEPFSVLRAAELEARQDAPAGTDVAVLDAAVTTARAGAASSSQPLALGRAEAPRVLALRPWLILLALALLALEFMFSARPRAIPA